VAERLRQLSAGAQVSAREPALRVTVSIGVASLSAQDADWQSLLARADRALYRAKEEGRNRVVVETPEAV
jgi:diguanylate cyclase (GGDEF)-like protein